jgi:NDP-sugar pyrophosphorylase family protein
VLCVGHLGEMIERDFGDGREWGVKLEYSFDGPVLLGTGGALQKALPLLGEQFFVLYGDSYLPIEFRPIAETFQHSGKLGLMTVFHNQNRFDTSNVWFGDGEIKIYEKKNRVPQMEHIDYGLSILSAPAFRHYPQGTAFDLADVMQRLVQQKQLAGFEVKERFYEIGSPAGLAELETLLTARQRS